MALPGEKNPPAMQETQVWSLCWEDALEEGLTTHSSILAWKIPWTEEFGRLQSMRSQEVGQNWSDWAHLLRKWKRCEKGGGEDVSFEPLTWAVSEFALDDGADTAEVQQDPPAGEERVWAESLRQGAGRDLET